MLFNQQERRISFGLLIMRLGLAAVLFIHAVPKLINGAASWSIVGKNLSFMNTGLPLEVLGLILLILETLGGICLISGYFFRSANIIMTVIYILYSLNYFNAGYKTLLLYAVGFIAVFFGLIYIGPGRYAVSVKIEKK
ncbi:MAG: DoxX family protein [Deltaproteobacteria bacterium]|nr:DoxX family protein [Deltaproteobacteria bacterium]MBW2181730.1 DoxX family protein [Deltaproteobacteria bacterium]